MTATTEQLDRLMDAIELVKLDRREEARQILRVLINENGNFEEAWLWMSLAVDNLDQSSVCLDNVLRVNPNNQQAAGALYRIRESERAMERRRNRYRFYRDTSLTLMWLIAIIVLFGVLCTYSIYLPATRM